MKPAFPTEVYLIPNCWKLLARQRQIPQLIPPMSKVLRPAVFSSGVRDTGFLPLSRNQMTGSSTMAPMMQRTILNVKPPT